MENRFAGTLPEGGMCALRAVYFFAIYTNNFAGVLPAGGVAAMRRVRYVGMASNSFTGSLPGHSIGRSISDIVLDHNQFAGTLPAAFRGCLHLVVLQMCHNYLEGSIPTWLNAPIADISHN
eukprot:4314113-Amphidinium_carterae.1